MPLHPYEVAVPWVLPLRRLDALPHPVDNLPVTSPEAASRDDDTWDAGDMGCGELIVLLRGRVLALPAGGVLRLIAEDPGAVEDIPAWCRMTRHVLVSADHPVYRIERRRS